MKALNAFHLFSLINSGSDFSTNLMVAPKSKVRPSTAGNFDSCLLCTEKHFSAHSEKNSSPPCTCQSVILLKETKSQLTQNVRHISTRWPYGHLACTWRKGRSRIFKLETENLPSFLLFSSPLLILALCKRCTNHLGVKYFSSQAALALWNIITHNKVCCFAFPAHILVC